MPPSRFAALSPWRNLLARPTASYSEIPVSPATDANAGRSLASTHELVFARGNAPNHLVALQVGEENTGKLANKAETITLPFKGNVNDVEVCPTDDSLLAVGAEDGSIVVLKKISPGEPAEIVHHLKHSGASDVLVRWHPNAASVLLSASNTSPIVSIWDLSSRDTSEPSISFELQPGAKSSNRFAQDVTWTDGGSNVIIALADGTIKSFDPRSKQIQPLQSSTAPSYGLPKPIRVAAVGKWVILSTLNNSRQRELRIYGANSLSAPVQTLTLDTGSTPLTLTVDYDRNLVFLGSRGDVTLRWIELDDAGKLPQGAFPLPPRTNFGAAALLAPLGLDVMRAEINRLYILTGNTAEVAPISIEIPQRQLIDYHSHLFPDARVGRPALSANEWLLGGDTEMARISMNPTTRSDWIRKRGQNQAQASTSTKSDPKGSLQIETQRNDTSAATVSDVEQTSASAGTDTVPSSQSQLSGVTDPRTPSSQLSGPNSVEAPTDEHLDASKKARSDLTTQSASSHSVPRSDPPVQSKKAAEAQQSTEVRPQTGTVNAPTSSARKGTTNGISHKAPLQSSAAWSRTTLSGSTPLLPAFSSVPAFDTGIAPSAATFVTTPKHLLYPLAGPGGRLAFHEIVRSGRLPEAKDVSWIETGGKIADFAADPFDWQRVLTLSEDSIQIWALPECPSLPRTDAPDDGTQHLQEYQQSTLSSPKKVVPVGGFVGRASKVSLNPVAGDIALVAGSEGLAVFNLRIGEPLFKLVDTPTSGEAEWSPAGNLIAFARSSDRKLAVWDPRTQTVNAIAAHDSPRPFKVAWIDQGRLATVGHTVGSMRQVRVFAVDGRQSSEISLSEVSKAQLAIDTSPAILFPHYDPDTGLLYLWSKGERSISAIHVALDAPKPKFGAAPPPLKLLPAFQHSQPQVGVSFLPKRYVNVRDVEVGVCFRLSKNNEIQRVSWQVARKRKEFFQDDVFVPTVDVETPLLSADDWQRQTQAISEPRRIDLQPANMTALSIAPPPERTSKSTLPKGPTQRTKTDKEREEELMNNVFAKAKKAEDEEEVEETAARRRAPADDDWGDSD